MQSTINTSQKRIQSIDILRGIVMVIMALDHVRDYFHIASNTDNPLNLATTTLLLFFTRWITHFCAPIFVFLSGVSVYLQSQRKSKTALSAFLIKRGLWLVLLELTVVSFAWSFNPHYQFVFLQVIWAIGISMIILGILIWLPFNFILALGLLIVFAHNLLDIPESAPGFKAGLFWDLLHHGNFVVYPYLQQHAVFLAYAFLPWTGLMLLGYCTGILFSAKFSDVQRRKNLLRIGTSLILFFILLRFMNIYGDPVSWKPQRNALFTLLSFVNVNKYPPSLLYMSMIIGFAFLFLAFIEKIQNRFTAIMIIYGRVPFFYYILHIYLVHLLAVVAFFARGHSVAEISKTGTRFPFYFVVPGEGYGLAVVYLLWLAIVVALYPLCKWYNHYKTSHKEKWWLSYL
jgi:uncharacterized membrane protein